MGASDPTCRLGPLDSTMENRSHRTCADSRHHGLFVSLPPAPWPCQGRLAGHLAMSAEAFTPQAGEMTFAPGPLQGEFSLSGLRTNCSGRLHEVQMRGLRNSEDRGVHFSTPR